VVPDSTRLDGATAIVTGAAQGVGRGIAEILALAGARIAIGDVQDAGGTVAAIEELGGEAIAFEMDVRDRVGVRDLMDAAREAFGAIDVLVNNAGIDAPDGNAWDLAEEEWQRTIDVNLTGAFHCSQAALEWMETGANIVNISSHASWLGTPGMSPAYNASKAGIIGLTMSFSAQLAERGIRVNAVAPGAIDSRDFGWSAEERAAHERLYPLGLGQPRDVGEVVRFLASPAAKWVTGTVVYVHGGFRRGGPLI
jgi:3-oxoacyl-[acyl-carrier protein] reductase